MRQLATRHSAPSGPGSPYRTARFCGCRAERAARERAAAEFQGLLEGASLGPTSNWEDFAGRYASDPRFSGVAEEEVRLLLLCAASSLLLRRHAVLRRAGACPCRLLPPVLPTAWPLP